MTDFVRVQFKPYKPKRKLSYFHCQELLYDYVTGHLDDERRSLVEEGVRVSEENQVDLRAIQHGIEYCHQLSQTQLSDQVFEEICHSIGRLPSWLKWISWKKWPVSLRWSSEALLVSLVVAMVTGLVPWGRLFEEITAQDPSIVIAQVERRRQGQEALIGLDRDQNIIQGGGQNTGQESTTKDPVENSTTFPAGKPIEGSTETVVAESREQSEIKKSKSIPTVAVSQPQEPSPPPRSTKQASSSASPSQSLQGTPQTSQTSQTIVTKNVKTSVQPRIVPKIGYVYRGFMTLSNLDQVTHEIVNEIESLGGVKAGSVKLGWRKKSGSYFHFVIDEANYDVLLDRLKKHGKFRVYKNEHKRIMPEGKIRFVLWVEEKRSEEGINSVEEQEDMSSSEAEEAESGQPDSLSSSVPAESAPSTSRAASTPTSTPISVPPLAPTPSPDQPQTHQQEGP